MKCDALAISFCHTRMSLSGIHDFNESEPGFPLGIAAGMTICECIKCELPTRTTGHRYYVCINNEGYAVSLELRKIYEALPDPDAERHGQLRIIDESGEDYLYPAYHFVSITLSQELKQALKLAA